MGVNISTNIISLHCLQLYSSMIPKFHDKQILTRKTLSNIYDVLKSSILITFQKKNPWVPGMFVIIIMSLSACQQIPKWGQEFWMIINKRKSAKSSEFVLSQSLPATCCRKEHIFVLSYYIRLILKIPNAYLAMRDGHRKGKHQGDRV